MQSIAQTQLSYQSVGFKKDNIGCSISQEDRQWTWQKATVEALDPICPYHIPSSLNVTVANTSRFSLSQIFHNFEWPNQPIGEHGWGTGGWELPQLGAHNVCVTPPWVHLHKVEAHDAAGAWICTRETFVDLWKVPGLACLSLYLGVLKWTLQNRPKWARKPTSCDTSYLETSREWNRLAHVVCVLPPGKEKFKDWEASGSENNWADASCPCALVKREGTFGFVHLLQCLNVSNLLVHVLILCDHLRLDCVQWVTHNRIGHAEQTSREDRDQKLFLPWGPFLSVWHSFNNLCAFSLYLR